MTEQEWLTSPDPAEMLEYLRGKVSDRKLRLWVEACRGTYCESWRNWDWGTREYDKYAITAWGRDEGFKADKKVPLSLRCDILREIVGNPFSGPTSPIGQLRNTVKTDDGHVCDFVAPDLRSWLDWNDGTAPKLAQTIYDRSDFGMMPILADALEEAGCVDERILNHCRGQERLICQRICGNRHNENCSLAGGSGWVPLRCQHVRGCHVVDLLLGHE